MTIDDSWSNSHIKVIDLKYPSWEEKTISFAQAYADHTTLTFAPYTKARLYCYGSPRAYLQYFYRQQAKCNNL